MTVPLADPYLLLIFDSDMKDRMDKSDGLYDTSAASAAISPSGSLSSSLWLKKWHFILSTSFHHILNRHYCRGSVLIFQCLTNLAWTSFYYDHSKICFILQVRWDFLGWFSVFEWRHHVTKKNAFLFSAMPTDGQAVFEANADKMLPKFGSLVSDQCAMLLINISCIYSFMLRLSPRYKFCTGHHSTTVTPYAKLLWRSIN